MKMTISEDFLKKKNGFAYLWILIEGCYTKNVKECSSSLCYLLCKIQQQNCDFSNKIKELLIYPCKDDWSNRRSHGIDTPVRGSLREALPSLSDACIIVCLR